jgi:hypothetical protein
MPAEPYVPQGELETLGWAKEVNFGKRPVGFAGGVWHCFKTWGGKMVTNQVARAPRASLADPYPGTGGRSGSGSLDIETDADTFPMALAFALGNQLFTAGDTIYAGQIQGAGGVIGSTSMNVTANSLATHSITRPPLLFPGMQLTVDAAGNVETITLVTVGSGATGLTGVVAVTFYLTSAGPGNGFTKAHATGTAVVGTVGAQNINMIGLGSPLPTFTQEVNRPGSLCTDYLGCKIDTLALAFAAKQGLTAKVGLCFQDMAVQGSPAAATLSAKNPYIFEQGFVPAYFCGEVLLGTGSSLLSLNLSINNNLLKDYHVGGGGNLVRAFPEQKRTVSGTIGLGFESSAEYLAAQAAQSGGALPPVSLLVPFQSTDFIGATTLPWSITMYCPRVFLGDWTVGDDTSKVLQQTLSMTCAESAPGANDQVMFFCVTSATAY